MIYVPNHIFRVRAGYAGISDNKTPALSITRTADVTKIQRGRILKQPEAELWQDR